MTVDCSKPTPIGSTCLEQLAAGWILPTDLCPVCTAAFITALDGVAGSMVWHPNFRARSAGSA